MRAERNHRETTVHATREELVRAGSLHWFHWLVVAASLVVTVAAWRLATGQAEEKLEARFEREAEQVLALVSERMEKYEQALWAGVGAMQSHGGSMDAEEWLAFSATLSIETRFPGINGIGVIRHLEADELPGFLAQERQHRPEFRIFPKHAREEYFPITYIEPLATNHKALGLDIAHERHRYEGAKAAAETGRATATGPIVLVQDADRTPGFLFYAPYYRQDGAGREHFEGMVYAPFVMKELMAGVLAEQRRHVGIRISDGGEALYDELQDTREGYDPDPLYTQQVAVDLYGRRWLFDISSNQSFRAAARDAQPWMILAGGLCIDTLLLGFFLLLSRANRRAIHFADDANRELEEKNRALLTSQEEALAANRAKDQFLANMSHELRTPLNSIIGLTEVLLEGDLAGSQRDHAETVLHASESLLEIIEDVLDFARIEAGKLSFETVEFDLQETVRHVQRALSLRAREKRLALTSAIDPAVDRTRLGDPKRLRQVLMNLLGNAIKFTDEGAVTLQVALDDPEQPDRLRFSVRDTGIGIDPANHERMFVAFEQIDSSSTRRYGGTGLGLPICRRLVEQMGGEIRVESRLGTGSTFVFTAELEAVSPRAKNGSSAAPTDTARDLPRRILLVEDSRANQKVALALLGADAQVTIANDGAEALERFAEREYDLVLMDVQMPGMDGFEATVAIRELEAESGSRTPILAMTAHALADDRGRCLAMGMDGYLSKPIRREELHHAIREVSDSSARR